MAILAAHERHQSTERACQTRFFDQDRGRRPSGKVGGEPNGEKKSVDSLTQLAASVLAGETREFPWRAIVRNSEGALWIDGNLR